MSRDEKIQFITAWAIHTYGASLKSHVNFATDVLFRYHQGAMQYYDREFSGEFFEEIELPILIKYMTEWFESIGVDPSKEYTPEVEVKKKRVRLGKWRVDKNLL